MSRRGSRLSFNSRSEGDHPPPALSPAWYNAGRTSLPCQSVVPYLDARGPRVWSLPNDSDRVHAGRLNLHGIVGEGRTRRCRSFLAIRISHLLAHGHFIRDMSRLRVSPPAAPQPSSRQLDHRPFERVVRSLFCALVATVLSLAPTLTRAGEPAAEDRGDAATTNAETAAPRVHLEVGGRHASDYVVKLELITGTVTQFRHVVDKDGKSSTKQRSAYITDPVCVAPCDKPVPMSPQDRFVITSLDVDARSNKSAMMTKRLSLYGNGDDLTIAVRPGSTGLRKGGYAAAIVGALAAVGGFSLALFVPNRSSLGVGVSVGGFVTVGGGVLMLLRSRPKARIQR